MGIDTSRAETWAVDRRGAQRQAAVDAVDTDLGAATAGKPHADAAAYLHGYLATCGAQEQARGIFWASNVALPMGAGRNQDAGDGAVGEPSAKLHRAQRVVVDAKAAHIALCITCRWCRDGTDACECQCRQRGGDRTTCHVGLL